MILSFSNDAFKERILSGIKIHTIRTDYTERWKKGQKIHFWRGNPRNTKSDPKPHQFHEMNCTRVQKIMINFQANNIMQIRIDNTTLTDAQVEELAIADGFDNSTDMYTWFIDKLEDGISHFKGKLIHWTKKKY